jgi:AraC-like DNA-binding protein/predicted transcriptional regulator YdeE
MEWFDKITAAIDYMETHMTEKMDYGEAAQTACCSPARFQNMFAFITGVTPAEYVRRRRMALAAAEFINTDIKVIDLSLKYGYESHTAFTRSFTAFHGFSPSVARKFRKYTEYPKISYQIKITGGHYTMQTNNQMALYKDILIKVETIELPETLKVACLISQGFAFKKFEKTYKQQLIENNIEKNAPYYSTGFFTDYFGHDDYAVGCIVNTLENLPEGLKPMETGVKQFAVVTFRAVSEEKLVGGKDGPGDGMQTACEYIEKVLLPANKNKTFDFHDGSYIITNGGNTYKLGTFEVYKHDLALEPEMCIYVPLK